MLELLLVSFPVLEVPGIDLSGTDVPQIIGSGFSWSRLSMPIIKVFSVKLFLVSLPRILPKIGPSGIMVSKIKIP